MEFGSDRCIDTGTVRKPIVLEGFAMIRRDDDDGAVKAACLIEPVKEISDNVVCVGDVFIVTSAQFGDRNTAMAANPCEVQENRNCELACRPVGNAPGKAAEEYKDREAGVCVSTRNGAA